MAALLNIDSRRAFAGPTHHRAPLVLVHSCSMPPGRPPESPRLVMRWTAGTGGRLKAAWMSGAPDGFKLPDD
jgi:hypothetical protein